MKDQTKAVLKRLVDEVELLKAGLAVLSDAGMIQPMSPADAKDKLQLAVQANKTLRWIAERNRRTMNLHDVAKEFATDDEAVEHLIRVRWPQGIHCVACDSARISRITSLGKTGKVRRVLECLECGWQFTATSGTLFHDSHLPLRKWFMAIALICEAKKSISALQLSRHLGVQHKTAWYLNHRIREAMQESNPKPLGSEGQVVEIDEVNIGGKKRNRGVKAGKTRRSKSWGWSSATDESSWS